MKVSKIKVKFGGQNEPEDKKLIKLFKQAYTGKLKCYVALIKSDFIKPFSDYKPTISVEFENEFRDRAIKGEPPPLYVYPEKNKFVMGDDYRTYFFYKKYGYKKIMCVVLGEPTGSGVIEQGKPFVLPPPVLSV